MSKLTIKELKEFCEEILNTGVNPTVYISSINIDKHNDKVTVTDTEIKCLDACNENVVRIFSANSTDIELKLYDNIDNS